MTISYPNFIFFDNKTLKIISYFHGGSIFDRSSYRVRDGKRKVLCSKFCKIDNPVRDLIILQKFFTKNLYGVELRKTGPHSLKWLEFHRPFIDQFLSADIIN